MGNETTIRQTSESLVTLLGKASIRTRKATPFSNDESFIGVQLTCTSKNWQLRIGYLPFDLDHLSVIVEDWEANDYVGKRLVPSIDRALSGSMPDAKYTGEKDGSKYEKPYSWFVPITDLNRYMMPSK